MSYVTSWVVKFVNFNAKTLVFLGNILSQNYSSFEQNSNLISYQIFLWVVKFWKCPVWNFRYVTYFPLFVKIFFLLFSSFLLTVECKDFRMCKYVLLHHASVEGCVELVHCCPLVSWAHIQCPICIVNTRNANILASVTKRIQDLQEKVLRSCVKTVSITVIILVSAPHHQCNNFWQNISRKLEGEWSCQVL